MQKRPVDFGPGGNGDSEDLEWTAVDALISANQQGMRVLEQYLLQRYYLDRGPDYAELSVQLESMIEQHERLVEDLRLARSAIDDLD